MVGSRGQHEHQVVFPVQERFFVCIFQNGPLQIAYFRIYLVAFGLVTLLCVDSSSVADFVLRSVRLVPTQAAGRAVPPAVGRERGGRRARREHRAMDPSPGGSGRYRPALARVGGGRGAIGRRERGGALAGRGESEARARRGNG